MYLARRYFGLSPDEWDDLPWWEAELLLEGLRDQEILGDGKEKSPPSNGPGSAKAIDLTQADLSAVGGVQIRRAG